MEPSMVQNSERDRVVPCFYESEIGPFCVLFLDRITCRV